MKPTATIRPASSVVPSPLLACAIALVAAAAEVRAQSPLARVSVDATGVEGDDDSGEDAAPASMSSDGRYVAFASRATNLVPNDGNQVSDVFVRDRSTGAIVRVSVDDSGVEANRASLQPALSFDGRFVAFVSYATNLANDTNVKADVYVHDRDPDGDGVFDEGDGVTIRASLATSGAQPGEDCLGPSISADGTLVAFTSRARNLVVGDRNKAADVFLRNLATGTTRRVSVDSSGVEGNADSESARIAADGRAVVFASDATNLVPSDTNSRRDVFLADLSTATLTRVSVDASGLQVDDASRDPTISDNGHVVAFSSSATNLVAGDKNRRDDVFVKDAVAGTVARASVDSAGNESDGDSSLPAISGDGQSVAFASVATNLVAGDTNGIGDVFVHFLASATTVAASSPGGIPGDADTGSAFVSGDGRFVGFRSLSDNLVPADTNGVFDVFVFDASIPGDATWSNYDAGFPGTNGIPSITASSVPELGTSTSVDVTNSRSTWSVAELFVGTTRASVPTRAGGTLLIGDLVALLPFVLLPASPTSLPFAIPFDPALCGFTLELQAIELDAGAVHGLSFTPGLELHFGG